MEGAKLLNYVLRRIRRRYGRNLLAVVHCGGSRYSWRLLPEGDIDIEVILRRFPPKWGFLAGRDFEPKNHTEPEVQVVAYSKRCFIEQLREGRVQPTLTLRFGTPLYDRGFFSGARRDFGDTAFPPALAKNLADATMTRYSRVLSEGSSLTCLGCYLRSCHSAAKIAAAYYLFRKQGVLADPAALGLDPMGLPRWLAGAVITTREWRRRPPRGVRSAEDLHFDTGTFQQPAFLPMMFAFEVVRRVFKECDGRLLLPPTVAVRRMPRGARGFFIGMDNNHARYIVSYSRGEKVGHAEAAAWEK